MARGKHGFTFPNGLRVSFTVGRLDRMPKCAHGRVEGFCACWDAPTIYGDVPHLPFDALGHGERIIP